jgi:hypothetical protein
MMRDELPAVENHLDNIESRVVVAHMIEADLAKRVELFGGAFYPAPMAH